MGELHMKKVIYDYEEAYIEYDPKTETWDIWIAVSNTDEEEVVASFISQGFAETILDQILDGQHEL